jgi:hypothetical protein
LRNLRDGAKSQLRENYNFKIFRYFKTIFYIFKTINLFNYYPSTRLQLPISTIKNPSEFCLNCAQQVLIIPAHLHTATHSKKKRNNNGLKLVQFDPHCSLTHSLTACYASVCEACSPNERENWACRAYVTQTQS